MTQNDGKLIFFFFLSKYFRSLSQRFEKKLTRYEHVNNGAIQLKQNKRDNIAEIIYVTDSGIFETSSMQRLD